MLQRKDKYLIGNSLSQRPLSSVRRLFIPSLMAEVTDCVYYLLTVVDFDTLVHSVLAVFTISS